MSVRNNFIAVIVLGLSSLMTPAGMAADVEAREGAEKRRRAVSVAPGARVVSDATQVSRYSKTPKSILIRDSLGNLAPGYAQIDSCSKEHGCHVLIIETASRRLISSDDVWLPPFVSTGNGLEIVKISPELSVDEKPLSDVTY